MRDRIRLYGARLFRFTARLAIFVGMMGLYSLALGSSDWHLVYGALLVAALTVGLVILFVTGRQQRRLDRSHQLAAEVRTLYPDFPAEEQNRAYVRRRRREMRHEALWYLLFAALSAFWFWALYAADASPLTWAVGVRFVLPGLVLISAGLLAGSFLPWVAKEGMPALSREETRAALTDDPARDPGEGEESFIALNRAEKDMTPAEYIRKERKDLWGSILVFFVAFAFFALLPLGMLFVTWRYTGEHLVLMGFIAFIGVAVWIIMCLLSHTGPAAWIRMFVQLGRMRSEEFDVYRDTLVSHVYGKKEGVLTLSLQQTGTVRTRCTPEVYAYCFEEPKRAAMVQTMGGRMERITLMPGAEGVPDAPRAAETAGAKREDDLLLDEAYCRQEALRKLEDMPGEQRQILETEIESRFDDLDRIRENGFSRMPTAERDRIMVASSAEMRRLQPDPELGGIERSLTEKLGVTRADILRMKKNPFVPTLRKRLILAAAVGLIGNLGTALAEKATGADLGFAYLAFSAFAGSLALSCGEALVNVLRFRKLQKAYRDPRYQQKLVDAAVYRELKAQVERRRAEEKEG